jgi:hypothetical protein
METRHCNSCNQVSHLVGNCPNSTGTGNQAINSASVGHVEYNEEEETEMDFFATVNFVPPQVPVKKEDFEKYVRLPKEATDVWGRAVFARPGHETYDKGPKGTDFGYWVCKEAEESDESDEEPF